MKNTEKQLKKEEKNKNKKKRKKRIRTAKVLDSLEFQRYKMR